MKKQKFNGHEDGYLLQNVVKLISERLESDGFIVSKREVRKESKRSNGTNSVYLPHKVILTVSHENLVPKIECVEIDDMDNYRKQRFKKRKIESNGAYEIHIVGERYYMNEEVRFSRIEKYTENVVTQWTMSNDVLYNSNFKDMKTRSLRFKDFRTFINEKLMNDEKGLCNL